MNRHQATAGTVCAVLAALALPVAPWAFLPLGVALLAGWDSL